MMTLRADRADRAGGSSYQPRPQPQPLAHPCENPLICALEGWHVPLGLDHAERTTGKGTKPIVEHNGNRTIPSPGDAA